MLLNSLLFQVISLIEAVNCYFIITALSHPINPTQTSQKTKTTCRSSFQAGPEVKGESRIHRQGQKQSSRG